MSQSTPCCSADLLQHLLQSDGHSEEERNAARHVDQCRSCQSQLEHLAAAPEQWRTAQESLQDGLRSPSGMASDGSSPAHALMPMPTWQRPSAAALQKMAQLLLSPPSHPEMLGRIGRYEVEKLIGFGGMGVVFKAFDSELHRPVAIKVLALHLSSSGAARQRFAREARAAAAVVHDHVVAIHNVESEAVSPFLVMPYVAGESLQQRLDREGPLQLCEILRIAMQTASGLAAAHAQGLIHRDVKPSNILLEHGVERALLTDFGLARTSDDASLTHTGYHPGTPQYMSPEQARGESMDARSDLFSLGSVVYAMCTGHPPFRAETSYGVLRRITDNDPRSIREINSQIPEWMENVVRRLLARQPGDRFQSAAEVAELLELCLAHVQQPTRVSLPAECQSPRRISRHSLMHSVRAIFRGRPDENPRMQKTGALVAGVVTMALLGTAVMLQQHPSSRRSPADSSAADAARPKQSRLMPTPTERENLSEWDSSTADFAQFDRDLNDFEQRTRQGRDVSFPVDENESRE